MNTQEINILRGDELDGSPEDNSMPDYFLAMVCINSDINMLAGDIIPPSEADQLREFAKKLNALAETAERPF